MTQAELDVTTLGERTLPSPLHLASSHPGYPYVPDGARVRLRVELPEGPEAALSLERAGPRERLFFRPASTRAALLTTGGLCPGLNNVVRSAVLELHYRYGVRDILGVRFGFEGLNPEVGLPLLPLGPHEVTDIHRMGGSFLGVSRGRQDVGVMADTLERARIDLLLVIGGDGTLKGAHALAAELQRRRARIAVVGVPKTIDADVGFVDKTFGFETAVEHARMAVDAVHAEATGARNGVGLVKLMGRDSGFVAATTTLAAEDVNFCLVPEVPFTLEGEGGLLAALERRLRARGHAVVVVAEGCGASLAGAGAERDASGNLRYASADADIGPYLRDAIRAHLERVGLPSTVKYIDPSYMIRSVRASAADAVYASALARHAVHAAMAGYTDLLIGRMHRVFTHVPLALATRERKRIDPNGELWHAVLEATGQPA
ncbi:ATP-dependent 6-phosphofructokinase [Aggregicoccus sp. 17bor-14]|nr:MULTISPECIES: ATP-dependent 6-phosphofructokinase [Myxococcaceae]MBF5045703.1 ATP-dependent 6-phosphofructokinase [Simulacricoccus sp. 17bor-14]MRI91439.1 ATP-dependent 6-phosphofructokinase [Aggregicoccus sp. 17bor-14]